MLRSSNGQDTDTIRSGMQVRILHEGTTIGRAVDCVSGINSITENTMPHKKHYDWIEIQKDYDAGLSFRGLQHKYGIAFNSLVNAKNRGDLITRTKSEASKLRIAEHGPTVMGQDARRRLSERMSQHNPGGKSKWYEVSGKKVQGTWERNFALYCNENNIAWDRCKPWKYVLDGKIKSYTPDFYLPAFDLYVEIKGRWWGNDRAKMDAVIEQHPDKKILIIEKQEYSKLYADVADVVLAPS